ncbi:MAG TPA: NAD/NADP octopine/nopaline dehydrogenase family protein [Geminicoccus sp.]|uniref:NAD/NADP octopine/nopaline dehydrogenase family protein n=1 Tax=Geminicoccus sp. TaxID=2024832 RepID=UPI002BA2B9ED|nr:NAD/NADP octopine/nopaline dehydrogenase family protein [Geminicoccus sp.]HWL69881.1 NAD/NADP octopine/nopaline dehydrogenase family protein [Geminicoccus sp.]
MQVAILGAGAIAYGTAALLRSHGHSVRLWSPSGQRGRALETGPLLAKGALEGRFEVGVAKSCADVLDGAEVAIVALPANGHRAVIEAAAPHLRAGQTVIFSSHASFGALYLDRLLTDRGVRLPIVVWGTTVVTGRQPQDDTVTVNTVRSKVDIATLPATHGEQGLALCQALFGDRFVLRDGLLAIALSNLNPQNHLGIAMFNLTRMERGETWGQGENVTPLVGRLLEQLDLERLAIAEALGLSVRTIFEHFHLSFHVPVASISEMNQQMHAEGRGGFGPTTAQSRYVLEDVPFGLVPTALLGRLVGRPAKLHEAGITLLSAAYGRDFKEDNDLLPVSGIEGRGIDELVRLCREGSAA